MQKPYECLSFVRLLYSYGCYKTSENMQGAREIYRKGQMMFGGDIQQEFAQKMQEFV